MNGPYLLEQWEKYSKLPLGSILFNKFVAYSIPYTGSIPFKIEKLEKGDVQVSLKECRKIKNHLNSIHAVALFNLSELCSGLCLISKTTKNQRGIPYKLEIEYHKKARGLVTAVSQFEKDIPEDTDSQQIVTVKITDESSELVCEAKAFWKIGSKQKKAN